MSEHACALDVYFYHGQSAGRRVDLAYLSSLSPLSLSHTRRVSELQMTQKEQQNNRAKGENLSFIIPYPSMKKYSNRYIAVFAAAYLPL
jgi:hypothetical protein